MLIYGLASDGFIAQQRNAVLVWGPAPARPILP
jgi:hypothetical protein